MSDDRIQRVSGPGSGGAGQRGAAGIAVLFIAQWIFLKFENKIPERL